MKNLSRIANITALGISVGALSWTLCLGLFINNIFLILMPVFFMIICIYGISKLIDKFPKYKLTILGSAILWLIIPNFIVVNFYFHKIPETIYQGENSALSYLLTTNKSAFSPQILSFFLGFFVIAGLILIIKGIISNKK